MTTSQNPYGPQARPAQPYAPMSHNDFRGDIRSDINAGFPAGLRPGPRHSGRHAAPGAAPQAGWNPGPAPTYGAASHAAASYGTPSYGAPSYGAPTHGQQQVHPGAGQMPAYGASRPHATVDGAGRAPSAPAAPDVPVQRSAPDPRPAYPAGGGQPPRPPRNGLGTAALVLGILAVLFAMIPIIGMIAWPLSIVGLVLGLVGVARTRSGKADNKGVAISGTVLSAIGLILCIVWVAAFSSAMSSVPTGTVPSATVPSATQPSSGGAFAGSTANDVVGNAGDTLTVGDMQISATALKPGDSTLGSTLCSTVTYRNTGSGQSSFNGGFDWKLQDPSGAALMTGFTGSGGMLSAGQLAPGGTTTGDVCFDRNSAAAGQYVLLYDPMSFSATRGAWTNQVG